MSSHVTVIEKLSVNRD